MFTSIPYDKGFTVKVDGEKVKYTALNDTFIIFDLAKGHHDIKISYTPYGFWIGLPISILSFLLVIVYMLYEKGRSTKVPVRNKFEEWAKNGRKKNVV